MLGKIKKIKEHPSLRGTLYRKMHHPQVEIPKTRAGQLLATLRKREEARFSIAPARSFVTVPAPAEMKSGSLIYPLIRPYAYANIHYDGKEGALIYDVIEPRLNEKEQFVLGKLYEGLIQIIDVSLGDIKERDKVLAFLEKSVNRLLDEYDFKLSEKEYVKIMYYIFRDLVGLNKIEALMNDPYIEDIGCLPEHEKMFAKINGEIRLTTIKEIAGFDDNNRTEIRIPQEAVQALSFNPETMKSEFKNIRGFLKKENRHGYYFDIRTEGGNHANVSPDHPMIILGRNGIEVKKAIDISAGEYVLRLKSPQRETVLKPIDVIDELSELHPSYRVKGAKSLLKSVSAASKILETNPRLISLWKQNDSMPVWAYLRLEKNRNMRAYLKVSLGQGVKNWIPAVIDPSEDLAFFIGMFLAEGYYEAAGISFAFGKQEKELHSMISEMSRKLFGVTAELIEHKTSSVVYCGGKILRVLFEEILRIGGQSHTKRVPEIAYLWNENLQKSLVKGYFLGDGYIRISDKHKKAVMATASKDLTLGIRYILYRLGIFTRLDKRHERFANTWEISLERGSSLNKFSEKILGISTSGIPTGSSQSELYPRFLFPSGQGKSMGIRFAVNSSNRVLHKLISGDVHPVRVLEVNRIEYNKPFYDTEVDGNSNFMHGDFIFTHNCDGIALPVYVVHQKFGSVKTNIVYNDAKELREFVTKLAERCDRYISYADPLLDGTLPDGARVQASLASDVTTRGPTYSIRKFKEEPFSPVDMIRLNTASPEMLAYLWFLVENGTNILITGGVATGKTSLLNSISFFIPPEAKIVSIEDSVTGDAEMLIRRNGIAELVRIGDLVDEMISKYGKGEYADNVEGIEVPTMDKDCKIEFQKPSLFIRHLVRKDIYEVTTATGKKVKVTKDHSLFGLDDAGRVIEVKPEELDRIKFIATPRSMPFEGKELREINLLNHLDKLKGVFLAGEPISKIFNIPYGEFERLGIGKSKYAWWKRNSMISAETFQHLAARTNFTENEISQLKIIGKRASVPMPVILPITDNFLRVLGLWVGDGSYDGRNKNRVIISNVDKECIEIVEKFASSMGIKVSLMSDKVSMSLNSTLLYKVMKDVLGFDGYSHTKRVPKLVHNLSNRQVSEFLKGYFSADGTVKNFEVSCSSQSFGLLNDIQTLLLRFGIISRISHYSRKDNCRELCISSSENIMKFMKIGFLQERKLRKINFISARKAHHTKTDIIPLGGALASEINEYQKLSFPYMKGMQNIGRQYLQSIAARADSQLLHVLAESDIFWDKVLKVERMELEELYVYDLSVPGNESFVCSNIVLHNTRELNLPHENWIPGVARVGFTGTGIGEVTMFELLRESFRQNPDYLIVGEIRGKEAYVMFQGMASIPGDQKVLVLNDKNLKRLPIGSLDAKSTFRVPTFDFSSNTVKLSPFSKVEHPSTNELYKITTRTGRNVTTTAHHSLFTYQNGKIVTIPSHEMKGGDSIAIPGLLPSGFNDIAKLDLISLLPNIRIFAPDYVKKAVRKLGYEKAGEAAGVRGVSDYYANFTGNKQSALHAKRFAALMEAAKIKYDKEKISVRFDRKSESFPAMLDVTPELLRLIGYVISEGSLNKSGRNSRIAVYSKNKIILEDMKRCIIAVTGKTSRERETKGFGTATELSFSHKVLFELLKRHAGEGGATRKIPDFIFGLSKEKIGEFLSGLYNGDGNFGASFSYYTISEELASDLAQLLLSYGIVASILKRQRNGRKTSDYEIKFYTSDEKREFMKYVKPLKKTAKIPTGNRNVKKIGDLYIDRITAIEKIVLDNPVKVYDLCVPGTQNFVGGFGGVVLHNSGHPSISTMHAGGVEDLMKRLQTKPINLSVGLIESLNMVIVMVHSREKGKSARRVKEIVEIESIDINTGTPLVTKSFVWIPATDAYEYKANSWLLNKVSTEKGIPMNVVIKEIARRKKFLTWLYENNITSMGELSKYTSLYYRSPDKVSRLMAGERLNEDAI